MNLLIVASSDYLTCKLNKTLVKLYAKINGIIQQMPNRIIEELKQDYPITALSMVPFLISVLSFIFPNMKLSKMIHLQSLYFA